MKTVNSLLTLAVAAASTFSASAFDGKVCPTNSDPVKSNGPDLDEKGYAKLADIDPNYIRVMRPNQDPDFKGGCGRGGDFYFMVRKGGGDLGNNPPNKFVLEFQGGGACWDEASCNDLGLAGPGPGNFVDAEAFVEPNIFYGDTGSAFDCRPWGTTEPSPFLSAAFGFGGLSDPGATDNPVRGWTSIYVPYCTKDLHMGTNVAETDYGFRHYGKHNVEAVLNWIKEQPELKTPETVLVTGCSAGAVGSGYYGTELSDYYAYNSKDTEVVVLGDSLMLMMMDDFLQNKMLNWGYGAACGALKLLEAAGGYPSGGAQLGEAMWQGVGNIVRGNGNGFLALVSSVQDTVQSTFFFLFGGNPTEMGLRITARDAPVSDASFFYSGNYHCANALGGSLGQFYENQGALAIPERDELVTWLTGVFEEGADGKLGSSLPAEPHYKCDTCTTETVTGCDGIVGSGYLEDTCGRCKSPEDLPKSGCTKSFPSWYIKGEGVTPKCMDKSVQKDFTDDGSFDYAGYKASRPYDMEINGSANMISLTGCAFLVFFMSALVTL